MEVKQHDFVTVIETDGPCNKVVEIQEDGTLSKRPASPVYDGSATTVHVPDQAAFVKLLQEVSQHPNRTLILGYIPGTEDGTPYRLLSKKQLARRLGVDADKCPDGLQVANGERCATRTKANFRPSSWVLFDYDKVDGMPESLIHTDPGDWWRCMNELVPGLSEAGYVLTPSTSSRVFRDWAPAFTEGGWHAYVQVTDAKDVDRFGRELLVHSLSTAHGFMRPIHDKESGEVRGHRPWAIFDPTTFTPERLVFDGSPVVHGDGLHVAPVKLTTGDGARLDTSRLKLSDSHAEQVRANTGLQVTKNGPGGGFGLLNGCDLKLSTEIETEISPMSVGDYWLSDHGKLRAQAVFRPESTSQAAYLNRHTDGTPFFFDVGTQTKYTLDTEEKRTFVDRLVDSLGGGDSAAVETVLRLIESCRFSDLQIEGLLRRIKKRTGIGLTTLKRELAATKGRRSTPGHPALAKLAIEACGDALHAQGTFWVWGHGREGVWSPVDDRVIRKTVSDICDEHLAGEYSKTTVDSVTDLVKTKLHSERQEFDSHASAINLANGELSLRDGEWLLEPHDRDHFYTTQVPVVYDPTARAPRFEQFLVEIFEGDLDADQKRRLVLEAIGYTLLSTCRFEVFFLLIGSGANGKSVLLSVVEALLGRAHVSAVQPSQFDNRFQRAHLRGKLANIVTEIAEGAQIADAELKAIVSGELTTAEHKLKPPFDFHPFATMWFGTNHMPHTRDFSDALFRRARILTFNNKFEGQTCDPRLADKLKDELPGILNMALKAVAGVLERGGFAECPSDKEARSEWRLEADQVAQFVQEECDLEPQANEESGEVYRRYLGWASRSGIKRTVTHKTLVGRLVRLGCESGRAGGGGPRQIRGLKLKRQGAWG